MSIRRIIFWTHLSAGVLAGIIILAMSATGVLMTYERQIIAIAELQDIDKNARNMTSMRVDNLDIDALAELSDQFSHNKPPSHLLVRKNPRAPIAVLAGRRTIGHLNRIGIKIDKPAASQRAFFSRIRGFHRWLSLDGKKTDIGKSITGIANLIFIFIIISGVYLWLPKALTWAIMKPRILMSGSYKSARTRDYFWHHIFGFWSLAILFILATTATMFSYSWSRDMINAVAKSALAAPTQSDIGVLGQYPTTDGAKTPITLTDAFHQARNDFPKWKSIRIAIPDAKDETLQLQIDHGSGGQPTKRFTVEYERASGQLVKQSDFNATEPALRTRIFIRYLHTGEVYGLLGQTLAGLASLGACFLVWTGLALAFRRFFRG